MNYLLSTLISIAVGALFGIFYVKVLKKPVLGNLWGGIIIGIVGGVLVGNLLTKLIPHLRFLIDNELNVDFVATFIGAFLLIWVFHKITKHQEE